GDARKPVLIRSPEGAFNDAMRRPAAPDHHDHQYRSDGARVTAAPAHRRRARRHDRLRAASRQHDRPGADASEGPMAMNWLVTGGCGFVGRTLGERLVNRGDRVRVFDNLSVGTRAALPAVPAPGEFPGGRLSKDWSPLELVVADIRDARSALSAAIGADIIVHLAANTGVALSIDAPREDCEHNVFGVLNLLEAARAHGVRRFVFASSGATLGDQPPPWHEDMAARPLSPYGASSSPAKPI